MSLADPPRTRDALRRTLHTMGVREAAFHLFGAYREDAHVLDHRPEGWVVYYAERGIQSIVGTFETEAEACRVLFERVTADAHNFFDLVVGPALPAEADASFDTWLTEHRTSRPELAADEWKHDDIPFLADAPLHRRYFVRITTVRRLSATIDT